jgi:hypothetical protein
MELENTILSEVSQLILDKGTKYIH